MASFELRPYQLKAVALLREQWRDRPILCLPTGAGKTACAKAIADGALAKGKRVLIIAHTRQIIEQTARRFECPMVMAEHDGEGPLLVASIQTLAKRGAPPHDVLIVDEAHHATARTYRDLVTAAPVVIGLTATPMRLDGRGLGDVGFGAIVEPVTVQELIDQGWLVEPTIYAKPFSGISLVKAHGEFTTASAEESMKNLNGKIAEHWLKYGKNRLGVAFACSVKHGEYIASALTDVGARVEAVSGKDKKDRRDDVLARLASRDIDLVVNCQLYGEGWDLPALDLCIMARPTASLTVYRQQIGRIMRPAPGKPKPVLLDHAGNTARHGFVTDIIEWSLEGRPKKEKGEAPGKTCPNCFAYVPTACRECPACGEPFDAPEPPAETKMQLQRIDKPVDRAGLYAVWLDIAWLKGYRIGWAKRKYHVQFAAWPSSLYGWRQIENEHYPCTTHRYENKKSAQGFQYTACDRCGAKP